MFLWSFFSVLADTDESSSQLRSMVMVDVLVYAFYFMACILISKEGGSKYGIAIKCIGVFGSYALNIYRDGLTQEPKYGLLAMLNYDLLFIA